MHRVPRAERPRKRVMHVLAQVSSKKTRRRGSSAVCPCLHSARACCTSSRDCSLACRFFFKTKAPLVKLMPQCGRLDLNPFCGQPFTQFSQCDVRSRFNPSTNVGFSVGNP